MFRPQGWGAGAWASCVQYFECWGAPTIEMSVSLLGRVNTSKRTASEGMEQIRHRLGSHAVERRPARANRAIMSRGFPRMLDFPAPQETPQRHVVRNSEDTETKEEISHRAYSDAQRRVQRRDPLASVPASVPFSVHSCRKAHFDLAAHIFKLDVMNESCRASAHGETMCHRFSAK